MLAYHNDSTLRAATIAQMAAHAAADQIAQGVYWSEGRGCAVGCLTHDPNGGHAQYPVRWGIPSVLAQLEDAIFENLPDDEAATWPSRFLNAIQCGADLTPVWPRFVLALLTDPEMGVARRAAVRSLERAAIDMVARICAKQARGEVVHQREWDDARIRARAVRFSADSHRVCAAVQVAYSHAYCASYPDSNHVDAAYNAADAHAVDDDDAEGEYSADAMADAVADTILRAQHFSWQASTLLTLLSEAR